jgi:hypothetical protein
MKPLLEIISPQCKILSESIDGATKERVMKLAVKWQHAGIINANKRRYSKEILQREITRLTPLMEQGKVYGSSFHPKDNGEVDDVSHLWESVKMESDGACVGVIKVVPTTTGSNVHVIVKAAGWLGMSSRGYGTVTAKQETIDGRKMTVDEVNSDYILKSPGDFVLDPSVSDAGVLEMMEAKEHPGRLPKPSMNSLKVLEPINIAKEVVREGIWWATDDKLEEEARYIMALRSGYRGSMAEFREVVAGSKEDNDKLSRRFDLAKQSGFKGSYLEFRKSLDGRK